MSLFTSIAQVANPNNHPQVKAQRWVYFLTIEGDGILRQWVTTSCIEAITFHIAYGTKIIAKSCWSESIPGIKQNY